MTQDLQSPSQRVLRLVRELNFEPHSYFIGGSGALALRDFRHIGDLDVGVTTRYWFELVEAGGWNVIVPSSLDERRRCDPPYLQGVYLGTQVHIFSMWRRRELDETMYNDYNRVFAEGLDWVHGIPVLKLEILLRQKIDAVSKPPPRLKDIEDIQMISAFLHSIQP